MSDNIVPFGKYKGQPVEVMMADASYCEWALAQPGIRERYPTFVTIVVNGGSAPDAPTPEHNRARKPLPPADYLRAALSYDPATGELHWKMRPRLHFSSEGAWARWNGRNAGKKAGNASNHGYVRVTLDGVFYLVHRLVWKMETGIDPLEEVDHVDTDRGNNRADNLRSATAPEQMWNRGPHKDGSSGFRGVARAKKGRWRAQMMANGVMRRFGVFDTAEEAHAAYRSAARAAHGEFYRPSSVETEQSDIVVLTLAEIRAAASKTL